MYESKQFDNWDQLEQKVRQRMQGQLDQAFEKQLQNDEFLQDIVTGLELKLSKHPSQPIATTLADKKQRIWGKMALALAPSLSARISLYLRQIWLELQYAQFQYLLGFNCSCVLLILAFCWWINSSQSPEEFLFLTQVELPEGFKP